MKINSLILKLLKNLNITYIDVGAANNLDSRWARFIKFNLFINRVLKYLFGKNYKSHLTY